MLGYGKNTAVLLYVTLSTTNSRPQPTHRRHKAIFCLQAELLMLAWQKHQLQKPHSLHFFNAPCVLSSIEKITFWVCLVFQFETGICFICSSILSSGTSSKKHWELWALDLARQPTSVLMVWCWVDISAHIWCPVVTVLILWILPQLYHSTLKFLYRNNKIMMETSNISLLAQMRKLPILPKVTRCSFMLIHKFLRYTVVLLSCPCHSWGCRQMSGALPQQAPPATVNSFYWFKIL